LVSGIKFYTVAACRAALYPVHTQPVKALEAFTRGESRKCGVWLQDVMWRITSHSTVPRHEAQHFVLLYFLHLTPVHLCCKFSDKLEFLDISLTCPTVLPYVLYQPHKHNIAAADVHIGYDVMKINGNW